MPVRIRGDMQGAVSVDFGSRLYDCRALRAASCLSKPNVHTVVPLIDRQVNCPSEVVERLKISVKRALTEN